MEDEYVDFGSWKVDEFKVEARDGEIRFHEYMTFPEVFGG